MIMIETLLPCVCGARAETFTGVSGVTVICDGLCYHEIIGDTMEEVIRMWNGAMSALKEAKNDQL